MRWSVATSRQKRAWAFQKKVTENCHLNNPPPSLAWHLVETVSHGFFYNVVFSTSIPAQIRQRLPYHDQHTERVDGFVREFNFAKLL